MNCATRSLFAAIALSLAPGAWADTTADLDRLEATVQVLRDQAGAARHPDLAQLLSAMDDFSFLHWQMRALPGPGGWQRMNQIRDALEQNSVASCAEDLKQAALSCMQPGLASVRTHAAELATRFGVCRIDFYKTRLADARKACGG